MSTPPRINPRRISSLSEAIRERGYKPDALLRELAADFKKLDALGLTLDSDPRKMTQAGQAQSSTSPNKTLGGRSLLAELDALLAAHAGDHSLGHNGNGHDRA